MRFIGACWWLCVVFILLPGCTNTSQRMQQLHSAQLDVATILQEQSEQLYIQQLRIDQLESDRQILVARVYELEEQVDGLTSQPEQADGAVAAANEPAVEAKPNERDSAFDKLVLGRIEWVWFDLFGRSIATRIDTGVKSSVIYASDIRYFERDGEQWVRFGFRFNGPEQSVSDPTTTTLEAPVVKKVRFKNGSGVSLGKRPAVRLRIKVGELVDDSLFLLVEKDAATHAVVMGRTFLRDIAVVDADKTFTQTKPVP